MGAFIPGFMLSALYMAYIAMRWAVRPKNGPAVGSEERAMTSIKTRVKKSVEGGSNKFHG